MRSHSASIICNSIGMPAGAVDREVKFLVERDEARGVGLRRGHFPGEAFVPRTISCRPQRLTRSLPFGGQPFEVDADAGDFAKLADRHHRHAQRPVRRSSRACSATSRCTASRTGITLTPRAWPRCAARSARRASGARSSTTPSTAVDVGAQGLALRAGVTSSTGQRRMHDSIGYVLSCICDHRSMMHRS